MPTLLFLLDRPRELTRAELARAASRTWRCHVDPVELDPTRTDGLVAGDPPALVVAVSGRVVLVHSRGCPYFPDTAEVADRAGDRDLARAVRGHLGWFSLDLVECSERLGADAALRELGMFAGQLVENDLVAFGVPEEGLLRAAHRDSADRLRRGELLRMLRAPHQAAMANHAREGCEEARRRWSEFRAAFRRRRAGAQFAVRVTAEDGGPEWLLVDAIEGGVVFGHEDGDPALVRVPEREVVDWLVQDGDELRGGFTLPPRER